jgi:hypothetical protein
LQLFGFLTLTTVILWPDPSYYGLLRYGTVPTLFTALPYILPASIMISSLYLGVAAPPEKRDAPSLLRSEILSTLTILSLTLPYAVLALTVSNTALLQLLPLVAVLLPAALLYNSLGILVAATVPLPTLRHVVAWAAGILLLPATALYLPAANPVIAAANTTGSAALLSAGLWVPELTPFPLLVAGAVPLLGAGILTTVVILWKG